MSIIINVSTSWLFNNLKCEEQQCLLLQSDRISILTLVEDTGVLLSHWYPEIGPSKNAGGIHAWTITDDFHMMIIKATVGRVNIILDIENEQLIVVSDEDYEFHFVEEDIHIDSCQTWELEHTEIISNVEYEYNVFKEIISGYDEDNVTFTVDTQTTWSGATTSFKGEECTIKKSGASISVNPQVLLALLNSFCSHGDFITVHILKSNILRIISEDSVGYIKHS